MINRTMVRTHVIQCLYAFYTEGEGTSLNAKKRLLKSFSDTYSLYVLLLSFTDELTRYAEQQIEESIARAKAMHRDYVPNRRFVNNRFAQQVFNNRTVRAYMHDQQLSWDTGHSAVSSIYKALLASDFYREYMDATTCTYEDDKRIWRKIYSLLLPESAELVDALDEMEVALNTQNWSSELDIVLSFVVKTLKRFEEEKGADQPILEMFDSEDELSFAKDLLQQSIEHRDEYQAMIAKHLKGWDADRIAFMDSLILQTALTEILCFPDIALEISLNEYIEIAKEYSSDKSYLFVNGILNEILRDIKREQGLPKLTRIK